jgi:hypothetical protein
MEEAQNLSQNKSENNDDLDHLLAKEDNLFIKEENIGFEDHN